MEFAVQSVGNVQRKSAVSMSLVVENIDSLMDRIKDLIICNRIKKYNFYWDLRERLNADIHIQTQKATNLRDNLSVYRCSEHHFFEELKAKLPECLTTLAELSRVEHMLKVLNPHNGSEVWTDASRRANHLKKFLRHDLPKLWKGNVEALDQLAELLVAFIINPTLYNEAYKNMLILGAPGTGKTTFAFIIGRIFASLGVLAFGDVIVVNNCDLIAGYLGQTAPKTISKIIASLENVLLIDEVYDLTRVYNGQHNDYGRESVVALMSCLDKYKDNIVVVGAGYEERIKREFLTVNEGLSRRFPFRFNLKAPEPEHMMKILKSQLKKKGNSKRLLSVAAEEFMDGFFAFNAKCNVLQGNVGDVENIATLIATKAAACHLLESRSVGTDIVGNCVKEYLWSQFGVVIDYSGFVEEKSASRVFTKQLHLLPNVVIKSNHMHNKTQS